MKRTELMIARPLAWLALAAVCGIVTADVAAALIPSWSWAAAAVITGLWLIRKRSLAAIFLLTMCVFACRHAFVIDATRLNALHLLLEQRAVPLDISAEGRVIKPLRRDLPGSEPGQAMFIAESITAPLVGKTWSGPVQLRLIIEKKSSLAPGRYRVAGRAFLPREPDNPGQFDERSYDLRHGHVAVLRVRESILLRADKWAPAAWLDQGAQRCRAWLKETLNIGMNGDTAAHRIIVATVLGGADAEIRNLEQPFRDTGTLHIFSVSGLHVGIVGWILWRLLKPLCLGRGWMAAIVCLMLFGYAFLSGLPTPTVRAAVMATVLLSGEVWQRRSDMLNSLGAAALLLLIQDSNQIFSIGFQISFAVVACIALFHRPILARMGALTDPDEFMPEVLLSRTQRVALHLRRWMAGTLSISTAAWIGSLPFCVYHFNLVTPVALLANMVIIPFAFMLLFIAILTFAAALAHLPLVTTLLGNANWFFAHAALVSAQAFAAIPGGNFFIDLPSPRLAPPAELTVLRLQTGGAALHLRTPSSDWLFDCGSAKDYDFLLRPYLNRAAVNHVTGLVLSHADTDHIGAAPFVVRDHHPERILLSAMETGNRSASLRNLRAMNFQPDNLSQGDRLDFGRAQLHAMAEVLYPPVTIRTARADDRAMVLRLDIGRFRILWCGDAGFTTEKFIVEQLPPEAARCDILIRNQHGNDISLTPEFLNRAQPRLIISSNNTFPESQKLPQRIRDACATRKIILLDQAATGAVTLRFWPHRLEVFPFRGPTSPITLGPQIDEAQ